MALEIERRFLVSGQQWRRHVLWKARLQQGYLAAGADGFTLRVRSSEEQAWLTIKAATATAPGLPDGLVRHEFEYAIPMVDAEALLDLAPSQISKWRHGLELPGGDWVLDVFEGPNAPLVVAEVELVAADQPLSVPSWCVLELTGRHELSNAALANRPLAAWGAGDRHDLLQWCVAAGP